MYDRIKSQQESKEKTNELAKRKPNTTDDGKMLQAKYAKRKSTTTAIIEYI